MISADEIAQAKAVPIAQVVGSVIPLKADFGLCPFHDERSPSLHIHRASNTFCCFGCGAKGDGIEFIRKAKGLDFLTAVQELCGAASSNAALPPSLPAKKASWETEVPSLVSELWRGADAPNIARWYLESRGIARRVLPEALRGHRRAWCKEVGQERACVLAAITDARGQLSAVQRIYVDVRLEYDGHSKLDKGARATGLSAPKKTLGPMGNGAVKLAAAGAVLGIAEGVESALAAANLYRLPVWAACGAHRMGNIELPDIVRQVVIFADRGAAGETAAAKAETLYRRRSYNVQIEYPDRAYGDFAEQVMPRG